MRNTLALAAVFTLATACGGTPKSSTTTGSGATGTGTGGESSTSGTTTGAMGGRKLPKGATCGSDLNCTSGVCGITHDGGNCCEAACETSDATCGALTCDNSGTCVYPDAGLTCAPTSCGTSDQETIHQCDGFGSCFISTAGCPGGNLCNDAGTGCASGCTVTADCATGFWCNAGSCAAQTPTGPCREGDACTSGVCLGPDGGANCCNASAVCNNVGTACGATTCDATTGDCVYPGSSVRCGPGGTETCSNDIQDNPNVTCDGQGNCPPESSSCAPFLCGASSCLATCSDDTSCVSTAYCDLVSGTCSSRIAIGSCSTDDACISHVCGLAGSGNCCSSACPATAAPCSATGCDPNTALCLFPGSETACGSILESCTGTTQQNPSACDGDGGCDNTPGTTDCTPFICGLNACFNTCTDPSSCVPGDICDTRNSLCCAPLTAGQTIVVDGVLGNDTAACCGYGSASACQTVAHAMALIDNAQAKNVIISASMGGNGGDWLQGAETYPIKLGWGAELSAPGVYFLDRNGAHAEIFDVAQYSANDTVGYASIVGTAGAQVGIGLSAGHTNQLTDPTAIQIEDGATLYIANAIVNGSAVNAATAIVVNAGGSLVFGQDQSAGNTGTVNIGNDNNSVFTDGFDGIFCNTGNGKGCTISDAVLAGGTSSVVIQGQDDTDIYAQDYAVITLTSSPVIGVAPIGAGFNECPTSASPVASSPQGKPDVSTNKVSAAAVFLDGKATVTFDNGTVQCISGAAFKLVTSPNGNPTLTIQSTTIQNTERAVFASAGTATISGSTLQFNYNGVEQSTDGTNVAAINLSGDGTDGGANSVICSDGKESITATDGGTTTPGVDVLNDSTGTLDANNVAWDTTGPDLFSCNAALKVCTCKSTSCTNTGGVDDMDAVNDTTGTITTTGNTVSSIATKAGCN